MNDPLLVRRFERLGDLLRDRQRLVERDGPRAIRCDRSSPSISSITRALDAVDFLQPWMAAMLRMVQRREHFASR